LAATREQFCLTPFECSKDSNFFAASSLWWPVAAMICSISSPQGPNVMAEFVRRFIMV